MAFDLALNPCDLRCVLTDILSDLYVLDPVAKSWIDHSGLVGPPASNLNGFTSSNGDVFLLAGQGNSGSLDNKNAIKNSIVIHHCCFQPECLSRRDE